MRPCFSSPAGTGAQPGAAAAEVSGIGGHGIGPAAGPVTGPWPVHEPV